MNRHMNLYSAIFRRKSIRKYKDSHLPKEVLNNITEIIRHCNKLNKDISISGVITNNTDNMKKLFKGVGKYIAVSAPHYIVISSEIKENYLENVGFVFENIILHLTCMGIGTCWVGAPLNKEDVKDIIELPEKEFPILLVAFGDPKDIGNMYRDSVSEFKRKSTDKICIGEISGDYETIINTARLSPSSINRQPWKFKVENNSIHVFCVKKGIINKKTSDFNKIDVGTAINHICIASEELGYKVQFNKFNNCTLDGYEYITTIALIK